MKKSKVTKITKMVNDDGSAKRDSYGNYSFIVAFENGDSGFYTSKNENQNKFILQQESEYIIEQKQGTKGFYSKITVPQTERSAFGFGGSRPQVDPKVQMISFAAAYTKDLIVGGKLSMDDLEKGFERMYKLMISKL